jgi:hypothetical protein
MDDIRQPASAAPGTDGVIEIDSSLRNKFESVQAVGFPGVISSHQKHHAIEMVQFQALDALIIANDRAFQPQLDILDHGTSNTRFPTHSQRYSARRPAEGFLQPSYLSKLAFAGTALFKENSEAD